MASSYSSTSLRLRCSAPGIIRVPLIMEFFPRNQPKLLKPSMEPRVSLVGMLPLLQEALRLICYSKRKVSLPMYNPYPLFLGSAPHKLKEGYILQALEVS